MPAGRPAGRPEISLRKSLRKSLSPAQPTPCFEKGPRSLLENGRFLRPHEAYSFFANGPLLRPKSSKGGAFELSGWAGDLFFFPIKKIDFFSYEAYSSFANGPLLRPYEARSSFENGPQSLLENGPSSTSTPPMKLDLTPLSLSPSLCQSL